MADTTMDKLRAGLGIKKSSPDGEVQVIRTVAQPIRHSEKWKECKAMTSEIEMLALETEEAATTLARKFKTLEAKIIEAYKLAPETDSGYGDSMLGRGRVTHALKGHMQKNGLMLDPRHYLTDSTKLQDFAVHISEGLKWLLKFS